MRGPASERAGAWRGEAAAKEAKADVAQLAERVLGKDEVTGSIPVIGSRSVPGRRIGSHRGELTVSISHTATF